MGCVIFEEGTHINPYCIKPWISFALDFSELFEGSPFSNTHQHICDFRLHFRSSRPNSASLGDGIGPVSFISAESGPLD